MEEDKQQSYYVVIPTYIFDNDKFPDKFKKLCGRISSLCKKEGFCWASNAYFAEELKCSSRTIQRYLKVLVDMGEIQCDVKDNNSRKIWLKKKVRKDWGKALEKP